MSTADTKILPATVPSSEWRTLLRGIRKRIAERRVAAGVSHRKVGQATRRGVRTSMRWCSGEITPDLRALLALSRLFQCKVSDLTGLP